MNKKMDKSILQKLKNTAICDGNIMEFLTIKTV